MTDLPDWFADLPRSHQVVLLASFGPWVALVAVGAAIAGAIAAPPLLAGGVGLLVGLVPLALFLNYQRTRGH